jgi:hypothetical protein
MLHTINTICNSILIYASIIVHLYVIMLVNFLG